MLVIFAITINPKLQAFFSLKYYFMGRKRAGEITLYNLLSIIYNLLNYSKKIYTKYSILYINQIVFAYN